MTEGTAPIVALPTRPLAVKWLVGLLGLRIAIFALVFTLAILFTGQFSSEGMEAFRRGWIGAAGFEPETYGPEEAGQVAGGAFLPALLAVLTIVFLNGGRLTAVRTCVIIAALFAFQSPLSIPFAVVLIVLAFRKSTAEYCAARRPKPQPATAA